MGVTFTPVFNRTGQANKSGMYSIHIRVIIDRRTKYINPKLPKVEKKYWSGKQNKWVKESHPSSFEINSLLQRKLSELDNFIIRNHLIGRSIDFKSIEDFYFRQGDSTIFNDFARDYVKNIKGFTLNTLKVYNTFLKHLDEFNKRIKFSELNESLLVSFKEFLQFEKKLKGGATKKYFDKFKVICKDAVKKGYLEVNQNPFYYAELKIKVDKPRRTHLEIDEIKKLINLDLAGSHIEVYRDQFLFQIFTGLYYKDLKNLTFEDVQENELGVYIIGNRIKNENAYIIPVYKFPLAVEIFYKYKSDGHLIFENTISDQKYNIHLKSIAQMAGIQKKITNKVARHSYVQLWMSRGTERQFVSRLVGHTEEDTTQEYYNLSIHDIERKLSSISFDDL